MTSLLMYYSSGAGRMIDSSTACLKVAAMSPSPPPFSGLIDHVNAVTGMMRGSLFRVIQEMSLRTEKEKNKKGRPRGPFLEWQFTSPRPRRVKSSHLEWVEWRKGHTGGVPSIVPLRSSLGRRDTIHGQLYNLV